MNFAHINQKGQAKYMISAKTGKHSKVIWERYMKTDNLPIGVRLIQQTSHRKCLHREYKDRYAEIP